VSAQLPLRWRPMLLVILELEAEPRIIDLGLDDGAGVVERLLEWLTADQARAALLEAALAASKAQGWK
jgi:hypothetical protein